MKNRVIYAHSRSPNGLLSSTLIEIVEKQLGDKLDRMSNIIRFHKDLFGGFSEYDIGSDYLSSRSSRPDTSSKLDREEKLSDPKRFQDFLVNFLQENKNYLAGLNVYKGKITFKGVAEASKFDYVGDDCAGDDV